MKKILIVVGTRPNYIKVTKFRKIADEKFKGKFDIRLAHTGQHFNKEMSDIFFEQLDILPDYFLDIPSSTANTQIAEIMLRLEKVLIEFNPGWVIVVGDVNSTLAVALCTNKCGFKLAHVESGLRSFDNSMPEEANRIITDHVSDLYFVTEQRAITNLLNEGKPKEKIHFVGNTMIDAIITFDKQIRNHPKLSELGIKENGYALATMHRPATVDREDGLQQLSRLFNTIAEKIPLIFPMHPRTKKMLIEYDLWDKFCNNKAIIVTDPLDYFAFQNLVLHCRFVITDSGGIQEETTFRQIPCLTLRPNTERPVTVTEGTNTLISFNMQEVMKEVDSILQGTYKKGTIPQLWDGNATQRILEALLQIKF